MEIRIINSSQVMQLMPMKACIQVMADVLLSLERGEAQMPLRSIMALPDNISVLGMMPAYLKNLKVMGLKMISVFPGNEHTEYESHQGGVMLFEITNGCPLALVDASAITAIRTAAVSAVSTKLLANRDAGNLAILGSGTQAAAHLEAMLAVRPIHSVRVWSLPLDHAVQFARRESNKHGIHIESVASAKTAVKNADIICTTTPAVEPVLKGKWIENGAHINAIGASTPTMRELDTNAVVKSRMFVDRRESTLNEAGEFLFPKKEGAITDDHIRGEIGEILANKIIGRTGEDEITLFKSLGLAVEDVAAANYIYRQAESRDIGTITKFGDLRPTARVAAK